ncbi:anaerobic ribonucleoside-triphosphate reductase activating protein [Methanobacterium sp.]|jgi:pyruvate formate lyase activating enzyme|uniref:anaerobic ribonucleoside-triphosphate reductase activating protein n=1 Tax=Methanobacterium sp. TaxID=2164 RepID=UPI003158EC24
MMIGDMIVSSLEFPGKISLVIFSGGCILKCPYCHNPELIDNGKSVELDEIIEKIESSIDFIDSVVITGGEALIQYDDVKKILKYCKNQGLETKLDTNGCFPDKLSELIDLLDYVALDIKAPFDKYEEIIGSDIGDKVKESMEICSGIYLECRTTYVPFLMDPQDVIEIAKSITTDIYTIQQFRDKRVLDEKLHGTHVPSRDELKEIGETVKPFLKRVRIKTAEFGNEFIN